MAEGDTRGGHERQGRLQHSDGAPEVGVKGQHHLPQVAVHCVPNKLVPCKAIHVMTRCHCPDRKEVYITPPGGETKVV